MSVDALSLKDINKETTSFPTVLDSLLTNVQVLDRDGEKGGILKSPSQGVAVLEAGMTAGAKGWATAIGVLGTAGSVATDQLAGPGKEWLVLVGLAAMIAIAVLAMALIVCADLAARAKGTAAMYAARAAITVEALKLAERQLPAEAQAEPDPVSRTPVLRR